MENIQKNNFNKYIDNINKTTIQIFNLIKLQNWNDLLNIIETNDTDFNYNIQDNTKTYLLEYLIIFNQYKIIKILLKKNIKIDIFDSNNKSILYNVIKFNYFDILDLFINYNNNYIGYNILELEDSDGDIPLFYTIKYNNDESFINIIINNMNNLYISNKSKENALMIAIKYNNYTAFKILIPKFLDNINFKNINGETILHYAVKFKTFEIFNYIIKIFKNNHFDKLINIINYVDYKNNYSILHYVFYHIDEQFIKLLYDNNLLVHINPNLQDISGNIFYHYFINNIINIQNINFSIIETIININNIIKNIKFNFNLYNIDGNTVAHLLASNVNFFVTNKLHDFINFIITNTDINIQNYNGDSVLFILIQHNYWKNIKNILINKKLDIFLTNYKNKHIFQFINNKHHNDLETFIDIVTQSYIIQLHKSNKSNKWIDYWDKKCSINYIKLNNNDKKILSSLNIDFNNNKNICYDVIYNKIKLFIELFIKNTKNININSYPITQKIKKLINNYPNVNISSYTGSSIDILFGLLFLHNKFNNISSSLSLININKNIINCNNIKNNENNYKICDIINFQILWANKKLLLPSSNSNNFVTHLNILIHNYKNNKNNIRFFIVPIGIELNINDNLYYHSNSLIFDFQNMEVERFEPYGCDSPPDFNYKPNLLDNALINILDDNHLDFKYIPPHDYLSKIGFQKKEISELKNDYIGDPDGFCSLWCIWWIDIRITNPDIIRTNLVNMLNKELINNNYSYKKLIRDYSFYITKNRDVVFKKSNTNINEWINDTVTQINIDKLNSLITNEITKIL